MCKYIVLMTLCCAYVIQRGFCQLESECGIVAPNAELLVAHGKTVKPAEFPWHVGLYYKSSKSIVQICGGTIVTPNLVVTAAHCVYKDGAEPGLYPASTFAVAAGKIYRKWNTSKDVEKYVQKTNVTDIKIPDHYKGAANSFTADIAILVLEKNFTFNTSFVRPVCIRFDYEDNLDGQNGRVAGWGLTKEGGKPSSTLQTVTLPFVKFEDCYNNSPEAFKPLIIHDKICAGYTNGTALCKGDSGSGLVFTRRIGIQNLYYLYGIVSISPHNKEGTTCSANAYTAFTDFTTHRKWFEKISLLQFSVANVCKTRNGPGVCKPLNECPEVKADVQKGIRPQICGFVENTLEVCCESTKLDSKHCGPIPAEASRVSRTGRKAWDQCIDYLQYVYPCKTVKYSKACIKTDDHFDNSTCDYTEFRPTYTCGHDKMPEHFVGPKNSLRGEFPHMALVGFGQSAKDPDWSCEGIIISKNFVLSAIEQCIEYIVNVNLFIRVGVSQISSPVDPRDVYKVDQIMKHPNYTYSINDIALLRTAIDIILDDSVYPACLPVGNVIDNSMMIATGWNFPFEDSYILQKYELHQLATEECSKLIKPYKDLSSIYNPETHLCAELDQEAWDDYALAGGSSLQIYNRDVNCMYTVVGISSLSFDFMGNINKLAIYTRVSHYISWIESNVWP